MRRHLSLLFSLFIGLFILTACPNGGGGGGSFSLSLSTNTLTVTQGASDTLTVNVSGSGGFSSDVNLSTTGVPSDVSTSFGTDPVTGGGGSSTLTVNVSASAATGTNTITVEGTSGSSTQTATFTLEVTSATVNVSGTVVDTNEQPVANTPVAILGGASTTTDASGNFSFSNVTTPYDLAVAVSGPPNEVVVYRGLTRNDPIVLFIGSAPSAGSGNTAAVQGTVSAGSGGQFPEPTPGETEVVFGSPEASATFSVNSTTGNYPTLGLTTVDWFGPNSTMGTLHALQWTNNASGFPTDYTGYGTESITLTDGGSFSSPTTDIALAGIANTNFDGTITSLPSATSGSYSLLGKDLEVNFGDQATIQVVSDPSQNNSFTYTTPDVSGATARFLVGAGAAATGSSGSLSTFTITTEAIDASGVSVDLFAAPELSLPADAASGIDTSSSFEWSAFNSGVYIVNFTSPNGPDFFVITDDTQTTIPDLANISGFNLPSGTSYDWRVLGLAPFASVDETAEPSFSGGPSNADNIRFGTSGARSFTTQ
ncbi:MAG: carboxypeptidase-like regulatory domain-containing protein [Trueperaceae bacterium]|nr:carboxypeptidase-like regulatory domain-containing protein [Trueperaceae bacterium]